ncbi:Tetratricopeptide TPR-1 [Lasiodiplodia theobromae]|uniref:Anaphase-promoting complex subunit 8 n=1 Tax=Lasiodiplodia theobromae TaxID=45133 RepID=A0A5N5DJQ9_9PEZI|nr:Tetratricopeptide TPR-1 [Lasiodiplodia theobromae]KAB2578148.1 Anaphase-promoting complex subunit 8 [Lasiodiplodia theobromae]KAF4534142.1 Tetratricopeptide TPR-1 [Lasiodiplodia theobromae]KAF9641447.1 Tetratricopeptide TPR-1 [Lasiodiplodia theobromae]
MSGLTESDSAQLQAQLRHAIVACNERCLYQSSKWAAELLNSFESTDLTYGSDTDADSPVEEEPPTKKSPFPLDPIESSLESKELHKFLLAKSFFDCREYDRCAAVFIPASASGAPAPTPSAPSPAKSKSSHKGKAKAKSSEDAEPATVSLSGISQKSLFLALYAKYMAGEKRKDEDSEMILGPADGGATINKELKGISRILEDWFNERSAEGKESSGWLEYLYGIVMAKSKNEELAKQWLMKSVHLYPYNWGTWQELSSLISSAEELSLITEQLPRNLMTFLFHIYTSQELYQSTEQIHNELTQVQTIFPNSAFLKTQRALLYYHSKDFEEAESIFSSLLVTDPYRLDALDNYSNILYVMALRPKLAFLAQLATANDKFRPETCCVVGNYYSLKSEHEKAVMYFRRALTLDRNFLSAWTLMGHEYVEMKNTHAAIESYRRAVDVNRKDYRAWYGLGQTYEMLEMYSYALFYFQRAASLRPYDPKMWQAVGKCFAEVGKIANGIRAYKRALVAGSYYDGGSGSFGGNPGEGGALASGILDPETLYQIALLYERLDDREECAAYMELCLAQEEGPEPDPDDPNSPGSLGDGESLGVGVTPTTSKARMWLARWAFFNKDYQRAMELANELCQDGVDVEDAKALVRDVRARIERERGKG